MKIIRINLNKERNEIVGDIKIIALADIHHGDKLSKEKEVLKVINQIKFEPNTYTILNGDLANVALKTSKSDVYGDTLTPMQQLIELSNMLKEIKDKILVISPGNHEDRIAKDTSIDITRLLARELDIEDRYADGMWYLFLSFGNCKRGRPIQYEITGEHSNVGGRKPGAKINRLQDMSLIVEADLFILSHGHTPIAFKDITYLPDEQHKTLTEKEHHYLMTNSFVGYGGYAEKMGLPPSNTGMTEATLDSKIKKIKLSI